MIEDLKDLVMVMLDIDIWGGDTALRVNDLSLGAGGHLPPKRAHKLGRKVIIDPRHLKCFDSIKNQAKGICGLYGLEFMGGYAVPVVHQDEAISRLDDLGAKFEEMKNHFLVNYDHFVEEWARQPANRDFADKIRDSKVKPDRVRNSLRFDYRSWEIKPANEKEKAKMEKDITGFVEQILDQVAETGLLITLAIFILAGLLITLALLILAGLLITLALLILAGLLITLALLILAGLLITLALLILARVLITLRFLLLLVILRIQIILFSDDQIHNITRKQ